MGQTALLPFRRKACAEDFFALKNPTVLARFEPANLGTKDQHATSRPGSDEVQLSDKIRKIETEFTRNIVDDRSSCVGGTGLKWAVCLQIHSVREKRHTL